MIVVALLAMCIAAVFAFRWWQGRVPNGWVIGPLVHGENHSVGLPLRPEKQGEGWRINIPAKAHANYVTRNGKLRGRAISIRYRVVGIPVPVEGGTPTLSFHFQRKGDDWSAAGKFEHYRWYGLQPLPLVEGTHGATIELDPRQWRNAMGKVDEAAFRDAVANMARAGVVFGNPSGRGHGVLGPATIELLEWRVA